MAAQLLSGSKAAANVSGGTSSATDGAFSPDVATTTATSVTAKAPAPTMRSRPASNVPRRMGRSISWYDATERASVTATRRTSSHSPPTWARSAVT